MKYGYFDDQNKEYIITTPFTPLPWINYLGNKDFFSLISNTGGGYSFYKDAKLRRITRFRYNNVPHDNGGRLFYIVDNNTKWSPSFLPLKTSLDTYECHHGIGYTKFIAQKNDLKSVLTCFVPLNDACEINTLTLKNNSNKLKVIKLFSAIEFCLWNASDDSQNFQRNYSTGEVEIDENTIYHKTEYRERRNHFSFYHTNYKVSGFDTDRDTFLGKFNNYDNPLVIQNIKCTNSKASGWSPIACFEQEITLNPNEEKTIIFLLGYIENNENEKWDEKGNINKTKAYQLIKKYQNIENVNKEFAALKAYWEELFSHYQVHSNNEHVNRMVNIWNQYQCMVTFNMSRSASYYESGIGRGMGFRDSCQDLLGFVHMIPNRARERIIDLASIQKEDGSTYHQYQPLTKKGNSDIGGGFNDDPLWLVAATYAYLAETNDYSILEELVPFDNDASKSKSLFEHLTKSIDYTLNNLGPHSLPLIGRADWNDCLNLNCFSKEPSESFQTCSNFESHKAESVFIAGMFVKYGKEYIKICDKLNKFEEANRISIAVNNMIKAIEKDGWDDEWFIRAYDAFSSPVGSKVCEEGKIYIEPQGMCVMAGVGLENGLAKKALESVEKYLDTKYGIVLLQPAYKTYHLNLGEVSSYPPGYKENAGIFCHNNPWISCAEATIRHGDRAFEIYKKICPSYIENISDIHRTEPYVYSQMIAGIDAPHFGEAKNSWLTGTSAWTFVNISQYILGVIPTLDGLKIDPVLPKSINEFTLDRLYQGCLYHIEAKRGNQYSMMVDNKLINGNIVPSFNKKEINVKITYID